jgi:hypothetical protein
LDPARLGQGAPNQPLGRDQIGKLELDAQQLFPQVLGLPSELVAALPIRSSIQPHCSPSPELLSAPRADQGDINQLADEAGAVRLLDALRQDTAPAIHQHDGNELLD